MKQGDTVLIKAEILGIVNGVARLRIGTSGLSSYATVDDLIQPLKLPEPDEDNQNVFAGMHCNKCGGHPECVCNDPLVKQTDNMLCKVTAEEFGRRVDQCRDFNPHLSCREASIKVYEGIMQTDIKLESAQLELSDEEIITCFASKWNEYGESTNGAVIRTVRHLLSKPSPPSVPN